VLLSRGAPLGAGSFAAAPAAIAAPAPSAPAEGPLNLRELEGLAIGRALAATGGHRQKAAELLGISERTLRNKLNGPADAE